MPAESALHAPDSVQMALDNRAGTQVEWGEPWELPHGFRADVTLRCSVDDAIAKGRAAHPEREMTDYLALYEFVVVNWATFVPAIKQNTEVT